MWRVAGKMLNDPNFVPIPWKEIKFVDDFFIAPKRETFRISSWIHISVALKLDVMKVIRAVSRAVELPIFNKK